MRAKFDTPEGTILTLVDTRAKNAPLGSIAVVDNSATLDILKEHEMEQYICVRWLYGPDLPGCYGQNDGHYRPEDFEILQEAYVRENFNLTGAVVGKDSVRFLDTLPDGTVAYGEKEPDIPYIKEGLWHSVTDSVDGDLIFRNYNEFVVIAHVPGEAVSYA